MGKFTGVTVPPTAPTSPVTTTGPALTHEGGSGFTRSAQSDLFIFAAVNMVGEGTFYEAASERDLRFQRLVWQVTRSDPGWVARFVPFLRTQMLMRSASVVVAAEYALALRDPGTPVEVRNAAPSARQVIASALQRPDEPGEFVAYWTLRTGKRTLPGGVQRGVADAVQRLYNERNAIKYDGTGQPWRLGDVVELAHPPRSVPWQGDLYEYLLDRRHHADAIQVSMERLPMLTAHREFMALPVDARRAAVLADPEVLSRVGLTWEILSSFGPMDRAAWEAVIPVMGPMALVRNLRNMDQAGVSDEVAEKVAATITDPEALTRARLFPYQLLSAYRATESLRWGPALEKAIDLATANVPALAGRWLVLVDVSGSMSWTGLSARSKVTPADAAALFGVVQARRAEHVDLVAFATTSEPVTLTKGGSVLRTMDKFGPLAGRLGGGTNMVQAARKHYDGHIGVVILTDMQSFADVPAGWSDGSVSTAIPASVPAFGVNLQGYAATALNLSQPNRFEIGGFSDKLFTMIGMLAKGKAADWPF